MNQQIQQAIEALKEEIRKKVCLAIERGWNCEAAVKTVDIAPFVAALSQPCPDALVPVAEPVKDHVIAQTVNELRDIAVKFHGAQQLRERIAHVVVPLLQATPQPPSPERARHAAA